MSKMLRRSLRLSTRNSVFVSEDVSNILDEPSNYADTSNLNPAYIRSSKSSGNTRPSASFVNWASRDLLDDVNDTRLPSPIDSSDGSFVVPRMTARQKLKASRARELALSREVNTPDHEISKVFQSSGNREIIEPQSGSPMIEDVPAKKLRRNSQKENQENSDETSSSNNSEVVEKMSKRKKLMAKKYKKKLIDEDIEESYKLSFTDIFQVSEKERNASQVNKSTEELMIEDVPAKKLRGNPQKENQENSQKKNQENSQKENQENSDETRSTDHSEVVVKMSKRKKLMTRKYKKKAIDEDVEESYPLSFTKIFQVSEKEKNASQVNKSIEEPMNEDAPAKKLRGISQKENQENSGETHSSNNSEIVEKMSERKKLMADRFKKKAIIEDSDESGMNFAEIFQVSEKRMSASQNSSHRSAMGSSKQVTESIVDMEVNEESSESSEDQDRLRLSSRELETRSNSSTHTQPENDKNSTESSASSNISKNQKLTTSHSRTKEKSTLLNTQSSQVQVDEESNKSSKGHSRSRLASRESGSHSNSGAHNPVHPEDDKNSTESSASSIISKSQNLTTSRSRTKEQSTLPNTPTSEVEVGEKSNRGSKGHSRSRSNSGEHNPVQTEDDNNWNQGSALCDASEKEVVHVSQSQKREKRSVSGTQSQQRTSVKQNPNVPFDIEVERRKWLDACNAATWMAEKTRLTLEWAKLYNKYRRDKEAAVELAKKQRERALLLEERKRKKLEKEKNVPEVFKVNGKIYKARKLKQPRFWCTKRLYDLLIKKMEPKYGLNVRSRAEKLMVAFAEAVDVIEKKTEYEDYRDLRIAIMKSFAKKGICNTPREFYVFCLEYMPKQFQRKVCLMILPGNKINCPVSKNHRLDKPILEHDDADL